MDFDFEILMYVHLQVNVNQSISLEIFCDNNIVGETASHRHVLLLVNHERVGLDFDVGLQALLVLAEIVEGHVRLLQFVLQVADAGVQLVDLLQQFVVRIVVAVLNVWATCSLLEAGLGHAQRRVFCRNVLLNALNVPFQFGDFLKIFKLYNI